MRSDYVNFKNYIQVDPGINQLQFFFIGDIWLDGIWKKWDHSTALQVDRIQPLLQKPKE